MPRIKKEILLLPNEVKQKIDTYCDKLLSYKVYGKYRVGDTFFEYGKIYGFVNLINYPEKCVFAIVQDRKRFSEYDGRYGNGFFVWIVKEEDKHA